jgi:hypothetical protein
MTKKENSNDRERREVQEKGQEKSKRKAKKSARREGQQRRSATVHQQSA